MAHPALTVLMTVRNGERYLREAVSSLLDQTYGDFRFLVLDNASTDTSREVVRAFNSPRIDLVELPEDIGQTGALNQGLQMIDTPWVARMDADDISLPTRLERQMSYLAEHPQVALLGTWCEFIDESGHRIDSFHPPTSGGEILDYLAAYNPFAHSSVMFRRTSVRERGGYPADYPVAQDYPLWISLSTRYQVSILPEELVQIRVNPQRTSASAEKRTAYTWDALRGHQQAYLHLGQSPKARESGRRSVAYAMLQYAEALSQDGRRRSALRWAGLVWLRYPGLLVRDKEIKLKMARVVLGRRGHSLGHRVKRLFGRGPRIGNLGAR